MRVRLTVIRAVGCHAHKVGGQGKSGEKPARTRHCDRECPPLARRAQPLGESIVREGAAGWTRKPGDLPTTTTTNSPCGKGWLQVEEVGSGACRERAEISVD